MPDLPAPGEPDPQRTTFDSWESYFYPETYNPRTHDGTLRNLYGERDAGTLRHLEYGDADRRSIELRVGIADVPRTYDAEHIRAIHGYVFQDAYEWAGYRELLHQMHHSSVSHQHSRAESASVITL